MTPMNFLISIVICTYNRKELLLKTIDSVINQALDSTKYEIVIVDNNSTDGTLEFIKERYKQHHNIRYLLETNQGISFSRNCGWQNSSAKYIAYIDDDEIADYFWLEELLKTIQQNDNNVGAVGGKVDPIWGSKPPEWLNEELSIYFSFFNLSDNTIKITKNQGIGSGNAIYPKEVLEKIGGFDTELKSRVGKSLVSGEDTLLNKIIMLKGYEIYYEPGAVVKHLVHSDRLTKSWLMKRFFWAGYSHSYIDQHILRDISGKSVFVHNTSQFFIKSYNIILNTVLALLSPMFKDKSTLLFICRTLKNTGYIYKIINK